LIPTYFTNEELQEINQLNQNISMLNRGVSDQQVGTVSISSADRLAFLYHYYNDNKSRALFDYNILVFGEEKNVTSIATRTMGQMAATQQMTAPNLSFVSLTPSEAYPGEQSLFSMPWVLSDQILNKGRNTSLWSSGMVSPALYRLPYIVTADEAASFFRLPLGSDKINAGFVVNEAGKSNKTYSENIINAGDIELGKLRAAMGNNAIGLSLKDLAKHMLIVGTPGSGKTTFSVGLLDRLWKEHHIPFLVIEPAKNEYRALVQSIPDLQVFTPGKNFISPFVFNPFCPPKNVRLETYKSTLKTAFAAGVSMSTPLDKIFEDTINNCYSDFRWLDNYTIADKGQVFNITDFIKCFEETFEEIGYTGDARNIGRAGVVRLKSLVNLFDNYFSIPIEDLLSKPTVIELAAIENADQKALIIALLLLSILAYVNANYVGEGGLRNFILLEEAHVLLDAETNAGGEGSANPASIAQGLVKRMLAEIRSYGVGIAIADQSPRKVGIDIVALTDIKVAFRLVERQDKEILADSTSMSELQTNRLAKLKPGEAFLFFNRLDEPEEIITPDYRLNNNISISLADEGIRQFSTYWNDKQDKLRPYPECKLCPYCDVSCDYNRRILAKEVARRIFKKYIGKGCKDIERLKVVLGRISKLIVAELNDEPFSRELLSCVKVYLWRHVKYDSHLRVAQNVINNSLSKK
jgi:DNA helicase HerA-like ATPase